MKFWKIFLQTFLAKDYFVKKDSLIPLQLLQKLAYLGQN